MLFLFTLKSNCNRFVLVFVKLLCYDEGVEEDEWRDIMKKKLWAMLLAGLMLFSTATVFAKEEEGYEKRLESAVLKAKSLFQIESRYSVFHSTVDDDEEGLYFHLEWRDKETDEGIYVLMNGDGKVENYESYKRGRKPVDKPVFSEEKALESAKEWLKKLRDLKPGEYKLEGMKNSNRQLGILFQITRLWNGIPLEGKASIEFSPVDGKLMTFRWGLMDNITYPSTEKLLKKDQAMKIYRKESGLSRYASEFYDYEKDVFFYRTYFTENLPGYSIDAVSGKLVRNAMNPRGLGFAGENAKADDSLSPSEKRAVDKVKGAISKEQAIAAARKALNISDSFLLKETAFYAASRTSNEELGSWRVRFSKEESPGVSTLIYVSIDAKTSEVLRYAFQPSAPAQGAMISAEAAKKTAEEFIHKLQPNRWKETVPMKENLFSDEDRRSFAYQRKIGDTLIATDIISVEVDPITGTVQNYEFQWKKKMPTILSGGWSLEKAYGVQEAEAPLELVGEAYYPKDSRKPVGRFVWRPSERGLKISAENGKLLDYSGKWKPEEIRYSDLEGAKHRVAIEALLKRGMGFRGGKFEEDKKLTQVEFFYLLGSENFSFTDMIVNKNEIYKWAMGREMITKDEIRPTAPVTKLDFAKLVVRNYGWEDLAKHTEIFTVPFVDAKTIQKTDMGYFALAYAKGFFAKEKGGKLMPYEELTRGQMAELLMHYFE